MSTAVRRARNAPEQYDDLAAEWWNERGPFAALHWLARSRGELIPPPQRDGAVVVDLGCGGGLMAPHVPPGYRHIGVDRNAQALEVAAAHGIEPIEADVTAIPLEDGCADVVVAGELFEHVEDLAACVAEVCRLLRRPGGVCVFDTINRTRWARLTLITIGERMPGGPPPRIHDYDLFVAPERLRLLFAHDDVHVERLRGLQPHPLLYARYLIDRSSPVRMVETRSLAALYQGVARAR